MKTLLLTFVLSLFCACAFPQKITGKWDCEQSVLRELPVNMKDIWGTYKFKKDGTFILKIRGEEALVASQNRDSEPAPIRRIQIQVKGKYTVENGRISSEVQPEDIFCNEDFNNFVFPPDANKRQGVIDAELSAIRNDKDATHHLYRYLEAYSYLYEWKDVPVHLSKNKLQIGQKIILDK